MISVRQVFLRGFCSTVEPVTLALPERGVVVVSGPNGAGKSSLVEAVAVGFFGRTLRGSSPWRSGEEGDVDLEVDVGGTSLSIERARTSGGKNRLAWSEASAVVAAYDSAAMAQEALERRLGVSWDAWRRTAVFSASDAVSFSGASDGERKRLLEGILGLGRFDGAHHAALAARAAADVLAGIARRDLERAEDRVLHARARMAHVRESVAAFEAEVARPGPTSGAVVDISRVTGERAALTEREREVVAACERVRATVATAESERVRAETRGGKFTSGECPTCGQPVGEALRARFAEEAAAAGRVSAAAVDARRAVWDELGEERERIRASIVVLNEAERRAVEGAARARALREAAEGRAERESVRGMLLAREEASAEAAFREALEVVGVARASLREAEEVRAIAEAVVLVLGLRGARAGILARALGGLEASASAWLARLGMPGLGVRLCPYSERKSGSVVDAISLEVSGAGGAEGGYKGASAGERRRIDLALLLGLVDFGGAGTVFVDEAFDSLDADGAAAAGEALVELAASRCVVVITHSEELAWSIPAVLRVEVSRGGVLDLKQS